MTFMVVSATTSSLIAKGMQLANTLQVPFVELIPQSAEWALVYTESHLELRDLKERYGNPFFIDFGDAQLQYRYQQNNLSKELLVRAVGVKSQYKPSVLDITAGLGRDAYLLSACGCKLILVERSPIIAALLKDGLERANCKLPLHVTDAKIFLETLHDPLNFPDVIYFDPIFPEKKKSASVKKQAKILRAIVGVDQDAEDVFHLAMKKALKRVVVKRSRYAPTITLQQKPDIVFMGKAVRFDVYLSKSLAS